MAGAAGRRTISVPHAQTQRPVFDNGTSVKYRRTGHHGRRASEKHAKADRHCRRPGVGVIAGIGGARFGGGVFGRPTSVAYFTKQRSRGRRGENRRRPVGEIDKIEPEPTAGQD